MRKESLGPSLKKAVFKAGGIFAAGVIAAACTSDKEVSTPFATSTPEPTPISTPDVGSVKELIHTFNDVFERLGKDFPETAITSIAEQPAYEFRQGDYRYTLRSTSPNSDKKFIPGDQILETVYYHGTGQDAPNDPIIEYVLDSEEIKAGYMWFGPGTNRESVRDEKTAVNNLDISSLQSRLKGDFETWSKNKKER